MSGKTRTLAVIASCSTITLVVLAKWVPLVATGAVFATWIATLLMVRELYARGRKDD